MTADDLTIRRELAADHDAVAALLAAAFAGQDEVELVDRLRQTPEYINALSLVAERNGQVVGFSLASYVRLIDGDLESNVLSLGPVAVTPDCQSTGIGGSLIRECIKFADGLGEPLIVLLGHADYYPRFGFERASLHGIKPPVDWPDENYMIRRLARYEPRFTGTVKYGSAWRIG